MALTMFCCLLLTTACDRARAEEQLEATALPDVADVAEMYGLYIRGDFDAYRRQMAALFKQRHRAQVEENGGPIACRVLEVKPNAERTYAEVFVEVTFNDRSFEEIMLPMVRIGDSWRLR